MAEKISTWMGFWKSLDYGPKGSFIAFALALIVLVGPLVLKLLFYIIIVVICMALGGLIGALIGWIINGSKKSRKRN